MVTTAVENFQCEMIVVHDCVDRISAFHIGIVITDEPTGKQSNHKSCQLKKEIRRSFTLLFVFVTSAHIWFIHSLYGFE